MVPFLVFITGGGTVMDFSRILFTLFYGEKTTLLPEVSKIEIRHGKRSLTLDLPKSFQNCNYLYRPEEMAGWLRAVLEAKHIRVRRCRFVLDSSQVYLQTLMLPDMTDKQQEKWIFWESGKHVPFEQGTYQAALYPWNSGESGEEMAVSWKEDALPGEKAFLLVALPQEKLDGLKRCAGFLQAGLVEVTAVCPDGTVLPINLLPKIPWKKRALHWTYKGLTFLCTTISLLLLIWNAVAWQQKKDILQDVRQQLQPLDEVKKEYIRGKELEYRIGEYRKALQGISRKTVVWHQVLETVAENLPDECWLEEIRGKEGSSSQLEIHGCSMALTRSMEFADRLKASEILTGVRMAESSERDITRKIPDTYENPAVTFILQAGLNPDRKGALP